MNSDSGEVLLRKTSFLEAFGFLFPKALPYAESILSEPQYEALQQLNADQRSIISYRALQEVCPNLYSYGAKVRKDPELFASRDGVELDFIESGR